MSLICSILGHKPLRFANSQLADTDDKHPFETVVDMLRFDRYEFHMCERCKVVYWKHVIKK